MSVCTVEPPNNGQLKFIQMSFNTQSISYGGTATSVPYKEVSFIQSVHYVGGSTVFHCDVQSSLTLHVQKTLFPFLTFLTIQLLTSSLMMERRNETM